MSFASAFFGILLEKPDPVDDGDEERGRPSKQDDSVGTFDGADQPPGSRENDVAVSESGVGRGREIERVVEGRERPDRRVQNRVGPDLDGVEGEQPERGAKDDNELVKPSATDLKPALVSAHERDKQSKSNQVHDDGQRDHDAGDDKLRHNISVSQGIAGRSILDDLLEPWQELRINHRSWALGRRRVIQLALIIPRACTLTCVNVSLAPAALPSRQVGAQCV